MCGICGEVSRDGVEASVVAVVKMTAALEPRGPDAGGMVGRGRAVLGHRRLKIIDLSEAAEQPMVDSELGLTIVYNGALYNYRELRGELEAKGYRFFSSGDTEVLVKGYHAWGERLVERCAGMFAFALLERDTGRLVLARDRLGIKPLYFTDDGSRFRFASSLPALLAPADTPVDLDPIALHHYLTFHAVVPAPRTIVSAIRKLPPATVLTLGRDGSRREWRYWELRVGPHEEDARYSFEDWQEVTLEALRRAVRRRLVADVPVGVLLSGGLDSSLVVALLAEAGHSPQTFSIGFDSVDGESGNEFAYSDAIARRFSTNHHRISVEARRVLNSLPACIRAMSEPMVSHDAVGFYLLSEDVAPHVKVVQSGQGADEIFAGYHWYPALLDSADAVADYARAFFDRDHAEVERVLHPDLVGEDHSRALVVQHFGEAGAARVVDKALRIDTSVMLVEDPVKRLDNMTMAWGLEARVPFLDHELVNVAARIPAEYKVLGGGKRVLKEAARRVVPAAVIDRPKGYFPVPALKRLRGPYLDLVRDVLGSAKCRQRQLFRPAYVSDMLTVPDAHLTPLRGSKLWQLALLELWLQTHGI
ncbi:MAG: N-acetylglutaminylglutamine amidotransferase [Polyangiaceae bacterium]|nr:N-acetylglutaminylglutamine amidotransferase [Polyangiaceae bacterium]